MSWLNRAQPLTPENDPSKKTGTWLDRAVPFEEAEDDILSGITKGLQNVIPSVQKGGAGLLEMLVREEPEAQYQARTLPKTQDYLDDINVAKTISKEPLSFMNLLEAQANLDMANEGIQELAPDASSYLTHKAANTVAKNFSENPAEDIHRYTQEKQRELEVNAPITESVFSPANLFNVAATSLGQEAIPLTAAFLARSPSLAVGPLMALTTGSSYADQIEGGSDVPTARNAAVGYGLLEGLGEKVGLGPLFKEGGGVLGRLARGSASEGLSEMATQAGQSGIDYATINPDMTSEDFWRDQLLAGIMGAGQGAALAGPFELIDAMRRPDAQPPAAGGGAPAPETPPPSPAPSTVKESSTVAPELLRDIENAGNISTTQPSAAVPQPEVVPSQNADVFADVTPPVTRYEIEAVIDTKTPIEDILLKNLPQQPPAEDEFQPVDIEALDSPTLPAAAPIPESAAPVRKEAAQPASPSTPARVSTDDDLLIASTEAASSPFNERSEPTEAQKAAGNYKKAHINVQGLNISIETPRGGTRSGKSEKGEPWSVTMRNDYGYVKGSKGADGEQVDVFVGPKPDSPNVFVIDQIDPDTGKFDEHKALVGFDTIDDAVEAYKAGFSDGSAPQRIGGVTNMPIRQFKRWLNNSQKKPISTLPRRAAASAGTSLAAPPRANALESQMANLERELDTSGVSPARAEEIRAEMMRLANRRVAQIAPESSQPRVSPPPVVRPDVAAPPARRARAAKKYRPRDLLEFLAQKGIRDEAGEIAHLGINKFYPGKGKLVRKSGQSLDYAREAAVEAGYGNFETVADFINALEESKRRRIYSQADTDYMLQEEAEKAESGYDPDLEKENVAYREEQYYRASAQELGISTEGKSAEEIRDEVEERSAIQAEADVNELLGEQFPDIVKMLDDEIPFEVSRDDARKETRSQQEEAANLAEGSEQGRDAAGEEAGAGAGDQDAAAGGRSAAGDRFTTEQTEAGQQAVIPGAEKISDRKLAERRGEGRKKATKEQKAADEGLFDTGARTQADLLETANQPKRQPESETSTKPESITDDDGDVPGAKVAFFDENGDAHVRYITEENGTVHLLGINATKAVRGREMVRWVREQVGKKIIVNEVAPDATGFWDRMQEEKLISRWTEKEYSPKKAKRTAAEKPTVNLPDPKTLTPERLYSTQKKIDKAFSDDNAAAPADRMTDEQFAALEDYARRLEQEIETRGKSAMAQKLGKKKPADTDEPMFIRRDEDSIADALTAQAKEMIGTTKDPMEAGYILKDGSMLDLSGRYQQGGDTSYLRGRRDVDHREIAADLIDEGGSEGMLKLIQDGKMVRVDFRSGLVQATFEPSEGQLRAIVAAAKKAGTESLNVEFTRMDNGELISQSYVENINVRNIQRVFREKLFNETLFDRSEGGERRSLTKPKRLDTSTMLRGKGYYWNPKENFTDKEKQVAATIERVMKAKFGQDVKVRIAANISDQEGEEVDGVFTVEDGAAIVGIALNQGNPSPIGTLNHEGIHLLKRLGLFTDAEWKTLTERANQKWIKKYNIEKRYGKETKPQVLAEEAIAEAYADYAENPDGFTDYEQTLFERIKAFLNALKEAIQKRFGWETWEDIFQKIETGAKSTSRQEAEDSPDSTRFNLPVKQATFYSALERAIKDVKQEKGPVAQWRGILRNLPQKGIKQEELDWTGVMEWLDAQGPAVSRQAILDYLSTEGRVDVQEVVLGSEAQQELEDADKNFQRVAQSYDEMSEREARDMGITVVRGDLSDNQRRFMSPQLQDAADRLEKAYKARGSDKPTKFQQYTLPGGGNYRELLITLPRKDAIGSQYKVEETNVANPGQPADIRYVVYDTVGDRYVGANHPDRENAEYAAKRLNTKEGDEYRSGHYDERNILAHVRFNERTDADGKKVLFLEEVQSDWHQAGRKKGYKTNSLDKYESLKKRLFDKYDVTNISALEGKATSEEISAIEKAADLAHKELDSDNHNAVPDAPFKKTWHELAMKRVLRYAAENGFDRVAWTTGDQQAERYDLSKQITRIGYTKRGDGLYNLSADNLDKNVFSEDGIKLQRVEDLVGKEIAQKIEKGEGTVYDRHNGNITADLTGIDLKIGGEGMKGFYDKILPDFVNKYTKKWGGKVGAGKISGQDGLNYQQTYTGPVHGEAYVRSRAKDLSAQLGQQARDVLEAMENGASYTEAMQQHASIGLAQEFGGRLTSMPKEFTVHSLDITPAMRESVLEGQPLFQRPVPPTDFSNFNLPEQGVMDVLRDANRTLLQRVAAAPSRQALATSWNEFRRLFQDRFIGFKKINEAYREIKQQELPEAQNVYLAEEMYSGRTGHKLDELRDKKLKPLFDKIAALQKKIGADAVARAEDFMYALHAPERNAQIKKIAKEGSKFADVPQTLLDDAKAGVPGSGMSDEEAAAIIGQAKKDGIYDDLSAIAGDVRKILDEALDERVRMLLMKPEQAAAMRDAYKNYYPLRGHEELGIEPTISRGKGFSIRGQESKRAEGRQSRAQDLLSTSLSIAEEAILRGEKNRVGLTLYNMAITNPNPNFWTVRKPKQVWALNEKTGVMEWRYEGRQKGFKPDDNTVFVKVNGEEVMVELKDRRLAEAMKNLNAQQANMVMAGMMRLNHWLSATHTMLNPEFIITNMFRDLQTAGINLQQYQLDGIVSGTLKDYRSAVAAVWRGLNGKDSAELDGKAKEMLEWFKEYSQTGAKVSFWKIDNVDEKRAELAKEIALRGEGLKNASQRNFKAFVEMVETVNVTVDNGIRLAAYVNARRAGLSKQKAASLAKNLTVNFNRRGEYGPVVNSMYLFANASIQGTAVMWQAMKNKKVRQIVTGLAAFGYAWSLLMAMISPEDDDGRLVWDKIPDYDKEANFIFMFPKGTRINETIKKILPWDVKSGVEYLKIPLPYGYRVFNYMGVNVDAWQRGAAKPLDATFNVMRSIVNNFNPIGSDATWATTLAPTILDPVLALKDNKNPLTGRQIQPEASPFDKAPPPDSEQYFPNVRTFSKEAAEFMNRISGGDKVVPGKIDISPETLDYVFDYFTGSAGAFAARVGDMGINLFTNKEMTINDIVFARKVLGSVPTWQDKSAAYDRIKEVERNAEYYKTYQKIGDEAKAAQFYGDNEDIIEMMNDETSGAKRPGAKTTRKRLAEIRKERTAVEANKQLSDQEKKTRLEQLDANETAWVNAFNRRYNDAMRLTAGDTRPFADQPQAPQ